MLNTFFIEKLGLGDTTIIMKRFLVEKYKKELLEITFGSWKLDCVDVLPLMAFLCDKLNSKIVVIVFPKYHNEVVIHIKKYNILLKKKDGLHSITLSLFDSISKFKISNKDKFLELVGRINEK